jgi:hypothetical protein
VPQRWLHVPQLFESFWRFWQAPLHDVVPPVHIVTQLLF